MEKPPAAESPLEIQPDWLEPFEWQQPPEWDGAADIEKLASEMLTDKKIEAALWLLYNREKAQQLHNWRDALHTVPAAEHYRNTYLWDSGFCAVMFAQAGEYAIEAAGYLEERLQLLSDERNWPNVSGAITELRQLAEQFTRAAVTESFWVVNGQKEDGFIPNLQFAKGHPRWFDIEWWFSADKIRRSSNYSQPPVLALSTMAAYKTLLKLDPEAAADYAEGMLPYLDRLFDFLEEHRTFDENNAMKVVVDPHETGMDSSVQWDYYKHLRPEAKGPDHDEEELFATRIIDGAYAVLMQFERWAAAGLDQAKQREIFQAADISFNCILFHNQQAMVWLAAKTGRRDLSEKYKRLSEKLELSILKHTWLSGAETDDNGNKKVRQKGFYSLKADGEPIDKITPSNIFVLLLPGLSEEQLGSSLDIMNEHLDCVFPLSSCSVHDPAFDPHNFEKDRLWRGPTWLNVNWYVAEFGLRMQMRRADISLELRERCRLWHNRLVERSNALLDINHKTTVSARRALGGLLITRRLKGERADRFKKYITGAREHYNPLTGKGQRDKVLNFAWSWLPRFMREEPAETAAFIKRPAPEAPAAHPGRRAA